MGNIGIDDDNNQKETPQPTQQPPQQPQQQQPYYPPSRPENLSNIATLTKPKTQGNIKIQVNFTPLLRAIFANDFAKTEELIVSRPQDINVTEPLNGYTPLLLAAEIENDEASYRVCKRLIEVGAVLRVMSRNGHTPFTQTCTAGNLMTAQYLAALDPLMITEHVPAPPILLAAERGHLEMVKWLAASGANLTAQLYKETTANKGIMAIHQAATKGHLPVVQFLVDECRLPAEDASNVLCCTPLYLAIEQNHIEVARFLLSKGCNPNIARKDGYFGLYMAAQKNSVEMVQLILSFGANPNMRSFNGNTALDIARTKNHQQIINILKASTDPSNCLVKEPSQPTVTVKPNNSDGCLIM